MNKEGIKIDTRIFKLDEKNIDYSEIEEIAAIINNGGVVAIPTETVYGLAANALNEEAIKKIFSAKGRPSDNPLIVHIASTSEIEKYACEIKPQAFKLLEKFSPGPLTVVFKKRNIIPDIVSGGLDSVALRIPSHKIALEIIKKAGVPLAAPSANISGSPSPTRFEHVFNDLNGKIDAIVDGGDCSFGVESTVISFVNEKPVLLRPGGITLEQLKEELGEIIISKAVLESIDESEKVSSPGMKYRHYAPKSELFIVKGEDEKVLGFLKENDKIDIGILCFDGEEKNFLLAKAVSYGVKNKPLTLAENLFDSLRSLDNEKITKIYARCPQKNDIGLAVYNRLIKAAGFKIIEL